ncbi:MAG: glycoside hydrolase family 3 N-terminal domain-containing protein [Candidatus Acidiferrales bacterium]
MLTTLKWAAGLASLGPIGVLEIVLTPLVRLAIFVCLLLCSLPATGQEPAAGTAANTATLHADLIDPVTEQKIDELLSKMTLEEKVSQLVQYSVGQPAGPVTGPIDYNDMIQKGEIGSLINVTAARDSNAYQRLAVEKSRLHIPILFGQDVIHGFRTEFPIPLGLASTWDPELVERVARVAAREASATGIRWVFSPMVDIARDARWGRMAEGAGEDPYLGSAMARAYVHGYQGERLSKPDSVAACAKHFVGYGAAEGGRDYNSAEISEHTLREFYLPPFHAAVDAGAASVMTAFESLNGIPASANPFTIKEILRKEWGFRGLVDSDWTSIAELIPHGIANDPATATRKAFLAGVEMDMVSSFYHDNLATLVRSGQVPESDVNQAVRDVLRLKFALGLFEHPYADEKKEATAMLQPDSVALAREVAERSFVLLNNSPSSNGPPVLPLSSDLRHVALIGPLADDAANMLGSWTAKSRPQDVVTLRAALVEKLGAERVHYAKGSEITKGSEEQLAEAVTDAKESDLVILALGEDGPNMTGEAASRAHLGLPGRQEQLLEAIVAAGKPVVLVLFSGRPLTLPWAFAHVPAVLAAWFPGVQAGPALVQTLFGESSPTGKLVVSWPRAVGQEPLYYDALNTGRPAGNADLTKPPWEGSVKYVSRYIDEQDSPQFPFGYGLTYTSFRFGMPQISSTTLSARTLNSDLRDVTRPSNPELTVSADVTNTGTRAGEDTVQLYVRLEGTSTAQPIRALKGFQHVKLAAGETQRVSFRLGPEAFALWDDHNKYDVEPSRVKIWVSPDSAHGSEADLEITK